MTHTFVGTSSDAIDTSTLKTLIDRCFTNESWYFLRWPDRVEFKEGKPTDFSCREGQIFDSDRELRWKRLGDRHDVLLLSASGADEALVLVGQAWTTKELSANFYPKTETRFPKSLDYPDGLDIGQRYFIDTETGIVQFIALRSM